MKMITPMEWHTILSVLNYIKEHADNGSCDDCFSYDLIEEVDAALEILNALKDKEIDELADLSEEDHAGV